jgi:cytidylate kinase
MIIAIDGPAGSGKSTTAKEAARRLGFVHLDTGAMYRAVTLKCLREGIRFDDDAALDRLMKDTSISFTGTPPDMHVWLDGVDVSSDIRSDAVTKNVSDYCKPTVVRTALVAQQREIGQAHSVVTEGRDVTTVVFPKAELKFYMTASVEERARRRLRDFEKLGVIKTIPELVEEINTRDHKDSTRANSPLSKAADAEEVDTTGWSLEQQIRFVVTRAEALMQAKS